jgi:hypothetical protein
MRIKIQIDNFIIEVEDVKTQSLYYNLNEVKSLIQIFTENYLKIKEEL